MATLLQPPAPVNRAAVEGTRPADDAHDLPVLPDGDPADLPPAMPVVVLEEDTDLELDAASLPDPAADVPPFPEPEAGLPYTGFEREWIGIYRAAWPHLAAGQRAEVARYMGCHVRNAETHRQLRAKQSAAEQRRERAAKRALAPAWAALVALAETADELVAHLKADDPKRYAAWLADLRAVHLLADRAGSAAEDALDCSMQERDGEGLFPAPELSDGYGTLPTDDRLAEFLGFAERCLEAVAAYTAGSEDAPTFDLRDAGRCCDSTLHVLRELPMWDMRAAGDSWPTEAQHEAAAERLREANQQPEPEAVTKAVKVAAVAVSSAPPASDAFPEPPAGLPYYPAEPMRFSIYRSAWSHLDADQRAEVRRLVDINVGEATERRADLVEAAARASALTPEQREQAAYKSDLLRRAFAGLDAFADLAAAADGWLRAEAWSEASEISDWQGDVAASGFVCSILAWEIADILCLTEKERAALPRPRLPEGHAAQRAEVKLAELLSALELCLAPADEFHRAFGSDPDRDTAETAARLMHVAHAARAIVACAESDVVPAVLDEAAARVREANP